MIMAWHKAAKGSLPCYSFGGMFRDSRMLLVARQVAHACGQAHQTIPLGQSLYRSLHTTLNAPSALRMAAAPVNHSPDSYVNERAAQIAPVRMTGNYGGEGYRVGFARSSQYRSLQAIFSARNCFQKSQPPRRRLKDCSRAIRCHLQVFREAPWHHYGLLALEETQLSLRSPYLDNEFVKTVFRAPKASAENFDVSRRLIQDGDPNLAAIRTDRSPIDKQHGWAQAIRSFLDFTAKAEYAYDYGMPQWAVLMTAY